MTTLQQRPLRSQKFSDVMQLELVIWALVKSYYFIVGKAKGALKPIHVIFIYL